MNIEQKKEKQQQVLKEMVEAPVSRGEIDNLKQLTDSAEIKIASGDLEAHVRDYENDPSRQGKNDGYYYRNLIFALIQIRMAENDAKKDWEDILEHKYTVSEKLGRNIGIHVAALDYYSNIKKFIHNPKIVEAKEYADTARHAMIDELTKAYNRRYFDRELNRIFKFSEAFDKTFSLAMVDIDQFKAYNDNNGHVNGDIALIEAVRIFHAVVGNSALVCRYGGEEFAIIFPETPLKEAKRVMESVREAIYEYRFVNEHTQPGGRLTVSAGLSSFSEECSDPVKMIKNADEFLYQAKREGRNRVIACSGSYI